MEVVKRAQRRDIGQARPDSDCENNAGTTCIGGTEVLYSLPKRPSREPSLATYSSLDTISRLLHSYFNIPSKEVIYVPANTHQML